MESRKYLRNFTILFIITWNMKILWNDFMPDYKLLNKDFKYVLLWSPKDNPPLRYFGKGQDVLYKINCLIKNCFFTHDRNLFGGRLKRFAAIMFNGYESERWDKQAGLPKNRYPNQTYVYANLESAFKKPICTTMFNNFFNWTITYRLDSNIPMTYFTITDTKGKVVGPRKDMQWETNMNKVNTVLVESLYTKTKAASWIVNNCHPRKEIDTFVKELQNALSKYDLTIDIYGDCANLSCYEGDCDELLKRDYFFYLALENIFDDDYVTEKVLRAVQNNAVPIVYGGANYSRFLPPNSYLDGRTQSPNDLASMMNHLIENPIPYSHYFNWTSYYSYEWNGFEYAICQFCEMLNDDKRLLEDSSNDDFRKWWTPNYKETCEEDT